MQAESTCTHHLYMASCSCPSLSRRAGLVPSSPSFEALLTALFASPTVSIYGFYCHAGQAYSSTSLNAATAFLSAEVDSVNTAAGLALSLLQGTPTAASTNIPFVLSVGSTPTAHAATAETKDQLSSLLNGTLELHAGESIHSLFLSGAICQRT